MIFGNIGPIEDGYSSNRRRRGSLAAELGFPKDTDAEIPLLIALAMRGGTICFSTEGEWLEKVLANLFQLNRHAREYSDPSRFRSKGNRAWRNHIQWVRKHLVDQELIDNSISDQWSLTERGWKRVHRL